jgi:hypothetical protein
LLASLATKAGHAANEASFFALLATFSQIKKANPSNRIDLSIPARYEPAIARAA